MSHMSTRWNPKRIKELRTARDWTQFQFATALQVGLATVSRWERGTCAPSKLAEARLDSLGAGMYREHRHA